jgi:hypothetical protein
MVEFLYRHGVVYVFENSKAQRVKVGMTGIGANTVEDRLRDVNDMWLERKVTCQICGGRLVNIGGLVPQHVKSGIRCRGGRALPLEKDVALAESYLENMKNRLSDLADSEKGSATRIVNTLEQRIERYRHHNRQVGGWEFRVAFYTPSSDAKIATALVMGCNSALRLYIATNSTGEILGYVFKTRSLPSLITSA